MEVTFPEGAPDAEFFRNITWIHFNELPARNVLANGRPVAEPTVKVEVITPQGALSDCRRQRGTRGRGVRVGHRLLNSAGIKVVP